VTRRCELWKQPRETYSISITESVNKLPEVSPSRILTLTLLPLHDMSFKQEVLIERDTFLCQGPRADP